MPAAPLLKDTVPVPPTVKLPTPSVKRICPPLLVDVTVPLFVNAPVSPVKLAVMLLLEATVTAELT